MSGLPPESGRRSRASERGFVTAETAMVLPTLLGLGVALALIVAVAVDRLRCADAAWEAARSLARGEPAVAAAQAAHRFAPDGAAMLVNYADGSVVVRVSTRLAFGNAFLPAVTVQGRAQLTCEPGTGCAADGITDRVR